MSISHISQALRQAVAERAHHRCEYCGISGGITLTAHEADHIIGEQHGGETSLNNLAYSCFRCNRYKGPNIASLDPVTSTRVFLYNPRTDRWGEHFRLVGATIDALTPIGRGTARLLRFNDEQRLLLRDALLQQGSFRQPQSDEI